MYDSDAAPELTVVIIGAARSGTKLLRDVLSVHPDVAKIDYDVNYLWRIGNEQVPHDELGIGDLTGDIRDRIVTRIGERRSGAPVLVEKTVSNCLRVPFVDGVFPQARFIHLIRDGRDVVESSYRQWSASPNWRYILRKARTFPILSNPRYGLKYLAQTMVSGTAGGGARTWGPRYKGIDSDVAALDRIEVCAVQWTRCVELAAADLSCLAPERVFNLRYEELVCDPIDHLRQLAEFLDLDIDGYERRGAASVVSSANVGKGVNTLTNTGFALAMPHMEQTLTSFGYI